MKLGLHKIFNKISRIFSLMMFNQRVPFSYVLFNFLCNTCLVNKRVEDEEMLNFHKSGFVKLNINLSNEIDAYKDKFFFKDEEIKKRPKRVNFHLKDTDKDNFIKIIKDKLNPVLRKLENYYNCDVFISDVLPFRIYHVEDSGVDKEFYSNHYHQDAYLKIYNKIHINLMDVEEKDGPLHIIPTKNRKKFFKSFSYKDRDNYNIHGDQSLVHKNIGKKGECCLFSSSEIMHKAGVPKEYRDMMQIIIITYPKKYYKNLFFIENKKVFFPHNQSNIKKLAKPVSFVNVIKIFITLFMRKRSFNR